MSLHLKCPKCGSLFLKRYEESNTQYVYCENCDESQPLDNFVEKNKKITKKVCPFCKGSKITIYPDESGFCKKCNKEFQQVKTLKCVHCGSDDIREYSDGPLKYDYCFTCGEPQIGGPAKFRSATIEEETGVRANLRSDVNKISKTGYYLMLVGAVVYFITFVIIMTYTPKFEEIQDYINYSRIMTALGFGGIFAFMIGSIIQIKELIENCGKV